MHEPQKKHFDYIIAGGGVIGLTIARELKSRSPSKSILIIEKEADVAYHGSGRNSGVLHAGFYYTANSLKAKFTRDGNLALRAYCAEKKIPINDNKKVVIAQSESDVDGIHELYRRGTANQVDVKIIDEKELSEIDPNVKTRQIALYSPMTGTVDPGQVCQQLKTDLIAQGVEFRFEDGFSRRLGKNQILAARSSALEFGTFINAAGLYADKIARAFDFSQKYTIIPFKGIYLKYTKPDHPIRVNVYPVPNLKNPFLGVHYTITVDNHIKIGPTAIPAFWRENYEGLSRFDLGEFCSILSKEAELFAKNSFRFRSLALEEMKKYDRRYFVSLAQNMVKSIDPKGFTDWSRPGIRAQLLNLGTNELVQDFVVEGDNDSIHVLNAVSPAFTSSFPFAKWIVDNYVKN